MTPDPRPPENLNHQVSEFTPTPDHLALKALLQRAFDVTWVHLNKQGVAAADRDGCYYRDHRGRSCAVGCHIPDNADFNAFEFTALSEIGVYRNLFDDPYPGRYVSKAKALYEALKLGGLDPDNANLMELLSKMQGAHDQQLHVQSLMAWHITMDEIANEIGLQTRAIDFVLEAA